MIKNLLKISGVLSLLLLLFTSCLNNDNKGTVYYFYDEPVVVTKTGDAPYVRNQFDLFYVPGLSDNTTLKEGDLLWTSFIVDYESRTATDQITFPYQYKAESFRYKTVDSAKVIIPADAAEFESYLADDYSDSIRLSTLYRYNIDSLWFFGFKQKDNSNYVYELILNPEIEANQGNYPTLYIRAKKADNSESTDKAFSKDGNIFAFDVADFADYYRKTISETGKVRFNLKYKTGVDANGKDVYREFMSNPISWDF